MKKQLPSGIEPPFKFRERGKKIEGQVDRIGEIMRLFEAIDVLNGALELVDRHSHVITICTDDLSYIEKNEYPTDDDMYYQVQTDEEAGYRGSGDCL